MDGTIEVRHTRTLIYYDGPRLFLATDGKEIYMCVQVEYDPDWWYLCVPINEEVDEWGDTPGGRTLSTTFRESTRYYLAKEVHNREFLIEEIPSEDVGEEWLPID